MHLRASLGHFLKFGQPGLGAASSIGELSSMDQKKLMQDHLIPSTWAEQQQQQQQAHYYDRDAQHKTQQCVEEHDGTDDGRMWIRGLQLKKLKVDSQSQLVYPEKFAIPRNRYFIEVDVDRTLLQLLICPIANKRTRRPASMSDDCVGACCTGCIQGICIACCATVGSLCCDIVCRPVCGRCCNSCFDWCEDCCGCDSRRKQRSYSYESAARYSDGDGGAGNYNNMGDQPIAVVPVKVQPPHAMSLSPSSEAYSARDAPPVPGYQAPPQATVVTSSSNHYLSDAPSNQEMHR